jgi:RNA polymerase sigma factor (sigma-70 family)
VRPVLSFVRSFPLNLPALIQEARQGLPLARRELARHFHPRLARMVHHYARRTGEDADDLLQEAWIIFFEALAQVDTAIGQPEHYLLRRTRWGVVDALRRARLRRAEPLEDAPEPSDQACEVPLADFLERLTEAQRRVASGLLAGLTFRELGSQLDCTSANIAYHVQKLREEHGRWSSEQLALTASPGR